MSGTLGLRNRQQDKPIDSALLRRMGRLLLRELLSLQDFEICLHLVSAAEIARMNERFLGHAGPTDVITFHQGEEAHGPLQGEIFVCPAVAARQARQFGATWQSEVVRYLIHGALHLLGHDHATVEGRRAMKREENRLLRELERRFPLSKLGNKTRIQR